VILRKSYFLTLLFTALIAGSFAIGVNTLSRFLVSRTTSQSRPGQKTHLSSLLDVDIVLRMLSSSQVDKRKPSLLVIGNSHCANLLTKSEHFNTVNLILPGTGFFAILNHDVSLSSIRQFDIVLICKLPISPVVKLESRTLRAQISFSPISFNYQFAGPDYADSGLLASLDRYGFSRSLTTLISLGIHYLQSSVERPISSDADMAKSVYSQLWKRWNGMVGHTKRIELRNSFDQIVDKLQLQNDCLVVFNSAIYPAYEQEFSRAYGSLGLQSHVDDERGESGSSVMIRPAPKRILQDFRNFADADHLNQRGLELVSQHIEMELSSDRVRDHCQRVLTHRSG
jgi:uncharacterized membrane protein YciS (DUF1049 family)